MAKRPTSDIVIGGTYKDFTTDNYCPYASESATSFSDILGQKYYCIKNNKACKTNMSTCPDNPRNTKKGKLETITKE